MIKFFVSTLAAAGIIDIPENIDNRNKQDLDNKTYDNAFFKYFDYDLGYTLAAHGSHSSHGSHGSHGSHQSHSNTGHSSHGSHSSSSQPSVPNNNNSTPPSSILPQTPLELKGNMSAFQILTLRVQAVLFAYGYYNGALDGVIGDNTKIAIINYQKNNGLKTTGTLSDELIKSLQIK